MDCHSHCFLPAKDRAEARWPPAFLAGAVAQGMEPWWLGWLSSPQEDRGVIVWAGRGFASCRAIVDMMHHQLCWAKRKCVWRTHYYTVVLSVRHFRC